MKFHFFCQIRCTHLFVFGFFSKQLMYEHNVQIKLLGRGLLLVKQNDRNTELLSAKSAILLLTVLANKQMRCQCCWRCQKHGLPFECLPVAVIVELIVGGESDEASPGSRQRKEDLSGCIFPHLTEKEMEGGGWVNQEGTQPTWRLKESSRCWLPLHRSAFPILVW